MGAIGLALNEALKRDPGDVAPPGAYERGLATIHSAYPKQNLRSAGRMAGKVLSRVAVAVCCLLLLFMTAFAVSPAVRERVYTLVKEATQVSTDYSLIVNPDSVMQDNGPASALRYSEPVAPEGFELMEKEGDEEKLRYVFGNGQGSYIRVVITMAKPTLSYSVDTEDADTIERIEINNFEGLYVKKGNTDALFMADTRNGFYVAFLGENADPNTLRMIADLMNYN